MKYFLGNKSLIKEDNDEIKIVQNIEKVKQYFEKSSYINFDTETDGLDPHSLHLLLYQVGTDEHQFVIDNAVFPITLFKELLETKELIIQNAKFDLKVLFKYKIVPTKIFDTFLAEAVLSTGYIDVRKSLAAITERRLGIVLDKTVRKHFLQGIVEFQEINYAAEDVRYLNKIKQLQLKDLAKFELLKTIDLENKFVLCLAYIEYSGMGFDREKWKKKCDEDKIKLIELKKKLDDYVLENCPDFAEETLFGRGCKVKWSSPAQTAELFKSLGIVTITKDKKTGKERDSVLSKLLESQKSKFPIIPMYIEYKKIEKLCSSFGENYFRYINPVTGRIHTNYRQILDTGRISCGGKGEKAEYPNLQQVPADERHRSCFIPERGNKMVISDYSSQESRVLVEFSKEPSLVKFYLSGDADLHSYTAQLVYKDLKTTSVDIIKKKHKDKREIMKKVNFGLAYGGSAITISNNANIPIEQAEQVYNAYFEAFPKLKAYFEFAKAQPFRYGFVLINNISKRKSFIQNFDQYKELEKIVSVRGFWDKYRADKDKYKEVVTTFFKLKGVIERKGLNYVIQGTSADMSKIAGWYLFEYLRKNNLLFKYLIPNIVHDELHLECPEENAKQMSEVLKEEMERAGRVFCKDIPIEAEVKIADNWTK